MKIGDKFWSFDLNRRRYGEGRKIIYREHYFRVEIIGETSRSWIIGREKNVKFDIFKVPKSDPFRNKYGDFGVRPVILTDQMVDDECFSHDHKAKISDRVLRLDGKKLREVAALIGYEP